MCIIDLDSSIETNFKECCLKSFEYVNMITPTCDEIVKLSNEYKRIPICKEIYADSLTPILLLRKIAATNKRYCLLESVEGGEKWGRYSFLCFDPIMRVSCKNGYIVIDDKKINTLNTDNPLNILRKILIEHRSPVLDGFPPFTGGFVGYFAYSMINYAEPILKIKVGDFNDYDLMLFNKIIAYDHLSQKILIIVNMDTSNIMENYGRACAEIEEIIAMISKTPASEPDVIEKEPYFKCNISKDYYCRTVERIKKYIKNGDIFQAVLSRQFVCEYHGSLINAYRVLRTTNPSPYMVYLNIDGEEIISTSPETLIRLQNGRLYTFPVAGSRPRGASNEEDMNLEKELLSDEKELSEHNMLVDLGRNDLGKVSKFGSVEVVNYQMVHRYSKIMHICSQVEGEIREDCDALSALEAILPAGTLSGAPKIRACEIINELEAQPRGIYGGALGYIGLSGNLDTCIAIRMAVKKDGNVYVQAGSGIVADSIPELEYGESFNKAKAVIDAITHSNEVRE